ncbi:MAG: hypothetical protein IJD68_08090 [Ruminococcus sp.]|nr:hypothetical protein [Ruminococcus sp.]
MDVKIENNDLAITQWGSTVYVESFEEIVQRIKIACTIKKGAFPFDRELGCNTHTLSMNDEMLKEKLEMLYKEATVDIPYCDLQVLSVDKNSTPKKAIIRVICKDKSATTEVTING